MLLSGKERPTKAQVLASIERGIEQAQLNLRQLKAKQARVKCVALRDRLRKAKRELLSDGAPYVGLEVIFPTPSPRRKIYQELGFTTTEMLWKVEVWQIRRVIRNHPHRDVIVAMHPEWNVGRRRASYKK
jgi:hypothetical protein